MKSGKNTGSLREAQNYCLLLLKFRGRSEKEIIDRLEKKNFGGEVIRRTCRILKNGGLIDDDRLTGEWIDYRLKNYFGIKRIKQELKSKGIKEGIIEGNISKIKDGYSEEDTVASIVRDKLSRMANLEPQKAKRRIYGYLLRRGFSPETITGVIERLMQRRD